MRFIVLFVALALSGCATDLMPIERGGTRPIVNLDDRPQFQALASSYSSENLRRRTAVSAELANMSPEAVRDALVERLSDHTNIVVQDGHGVYTEYTSPDGLVYMWYPANGEVVRGTWGVVEGMVGLSGTFSEPNTLPRACFQYRGARHGVTGEWEPNECVDAEQILGGMFVIDSRPGDLFGLSQHGIPFVIYRDEIPIWPNEIDAARARRDATEAAGQTPSD
tara:strand:- start:5659 stop:6327 length:669 start_codon:yes stop_codon:yes gene_type:complete